MVIAVSAAIAGVFWSGILIGITCWMRKKRFFIRGFGIWSIVCVYLFSMLRMLLPLNFDFTVGIQVRGLFSDIFYSICIHKYRVGDYYVTIFEGLMLVWAVGALFFLLRFSFQYWDACKTLRDKEKGTEAESVQYKKILQDIYELKGKRREITVVKSGQIHMPIGIGIFKRRVLLPSLDYTEQELYYILLHEYTHFLNGDLLIKMAVHIFCCIFWWNPAAYLLRKDLEQSLEIKCDLCITEKFSAGEAANYLEAILKTLKSVGEKDELDLKSKVALCGKKESAITERFQYVFKNVKNKGESKKAVAAWIAVVCVIWAASCTAFVIPSHDPPVEDIVTEPGVIEMTPENTYVVYENGKYEIYVNDKSTGECKENFVNMLKNSGFETRGMWR